MATVGMALRFESRRVRTVAYSVLVWLLALVWFTPVLWMLATSLKPGAVAISENPPRWVPNPFTLENYLLVARPAGGISLVRAFVVSAVVATAATLAVLVTSTPAAYALSLLRFRTQRIVFWTYVASLALPGAVLLVPNYWLVAWMGLLDHLLALILPGLGGAFGVFLLRQYMLGIPRELEDAAQIDGCSSLRFLVAVVVPLIKPALLVLGLISFLGSWNALLWPLLVINSPDKLTLPLALVRFRGGWADLLRGVGPLMSGSFLAVGPVLVLFILFHRYLMRGVSFGVGK